MNMVIRVIDFETTGFPPKAAVCEAGWTDVIADDGTVTIKDTVSRLINPGRSIPPEVSKIHGITDAMVAEAPPPDVVFGEMMAGAEVFCAHSAAFELKFFQGGKTPWICTYKAALALRPGLNSYKNGNLPAILNIDLDAARCEPLHRAGPDTYVTARILESLLTKGATVHELIVISAEAKRVSRMPFGKFKGTEIRQLSDEYLAWACRTIGAPDVRTALTAERNRRRA